MQLREFDQRQDSKAVWLSDDEIASLLNATETEEKRFGLGIMARSGLRVAEAASVASDDLVETNCGSIVRVWEGKNDEYRESPVPSDLFYLGRALGRDRDHVVDVSKRTLQRWVEECADRMFDRQDEVGWSFVTAHDLRRSWATLMIQANVENLLIMEYGGWSDIETFQDHYASIHDPGFQKDEQEKVSWL